jgi:hypothetical protein
MAMNPGGIQDTYMGIEYQFSLLLLSAHQSHASGIKFKLSTEQRNIGRFDDIILQIDEGGKIRYFFGQAKYKKTAGVLEFKTFIADKKFQLSLYFESWDEILN